MALGFFRRRQKMVIIIMVVLMVSFLVGSYGFNMLFSTDPMAIELGQTRTGTLTRRDLRRAELELAVLGRGGLGFHTAEEMQAILGRFLRIPRDQPMSPLQVCHWFARLRFLRPTEDGYALVTSIGQGPVGYALLLQEAEERSILVSEGDVNTFFQEVGYRGEQYEQLLSNLRAAQRGWTEGLLRQTVRNWLLINKCLVEANVNCPPSEAEVRLAFRDVVEQIDLRVMRLKAADYVQDVPDPNQARIDAHFNLYRTRFPRQTRKVGDMGFGYRQPGRASVQYLFVRGDVIARVTAPDQNEVDDYYNKHKAEFVKKVPIGPATTAPAGGATTQSTQATRPTRDVPMTYPEAKPRIMEILRPRTVEKKVRDMTLQVEAAIRRLEGRTDPNQVFATARTEATESAEQALAVRLRGVKIDDAPLDEAVAKLALAAKLQAICYPWGTHTGQTLLPSVKVTLQADGMTLGEALERIGKQVKWPPEGAGKLRWALCGGFKGVLFSVAAEGEGIDFFPLAVDQTPLSTFQELAEDEVLGYAYANPAGGSTLAQTVFSAKGLSTDSRQTPMARIRETGPRMYVMGDRTGRVVWRLVEISPAHVPASLADRPELRRKVVEDLKLLDAFEKATKVAKTLKDAAESVSGGLETLAGPQKKETITTGLFARKTFGGGWSNVPKLDLTTPELRAYVIDKVFSLVPKDVEPTAPKGPPAVLVVPIPLQREVLVVERIGFRPVVRPEYEQAGRLDTAQVLGMIRQQAVQTIWFDIRSIMQRVGFKRSTDQ